MRKILATIVAAGAMTFGVIGAHAASVTVSCPGTAVTTDREFAVTTDPGTATCLAFGTGNISGESGDPFLQAFAGYELIDKSDDGSSGTMPTALDGSTSDLISGTSGDFSFASTLWNTYSAIAIGFKSGQGQLDPDWAVLGLPSMVSNGTWTISGNQALSHVNLYGIPGTTVVPLPAAGWMLLAGIGGLAALRRRKAV